MPGADDVKPSTAGALRDLHERFMVEERVVASPVRRRLYLIAMLLVVVPLVAFVAILIDVLRGGELSSIDAPVQAWLNSVQSDFLTATMTGLSVAFGPPVFPIVALVLVLGWVFTARHAWRPLLLAGGTLVAIVGVRLIAELVDRARPPVRGMLIGPELSESFPSGHVVGAATIMLLTAYLVFSRRGNPRAAVAAFVVASLGLVATAASRVYLGYHWATDAVGAACVALIVLGLVIAIDTHRTVRVTDAGSPAPGAAPVSGGSSTAEHG